MIFWAICQTILFAKIICTKESTKKNINQSTILGDIKYEIVEKKQPNPSLPIVT